MRVTSDSGKRGAGGHEESSGDLSRRNFLQVGAAGAVVLSAGGLLVACGSDDDDSTEGSGGGSSDVTFGFSHPFAEVPIVATVQDLVKEIAEGDGWKVQIDETQEGKLEEQLATLDTWITQKITAINAFPSDPSAFEATAKRAIDAGIIWTTYSLPMENAAGGALFPPELSGEVTGKATVDWINANDPEAEVLILEVPLGGVPRKRTDIPKQMISQQTKAKIVAVQGAIEQSKGLQVTEDVLQANPNVTVVVGHNDDGALGAAEAFRKAGKQDPSKVWIVGQDGSEDALTALKKGNTFFRASAALDIHKLCEEVVGVTKRAIERDWKPGDTQEYTKLAPTLVQVGDTQLIDRFLSALK